MFGVRQAEEKYKRMIKKIDSKIVGYSIKKTGAANVDSAPIKELMNEEIDRPEKCKVKYLDYDGNQKNLKAEGLLATCIQHEIDHLNGKLIVDYASSLKRSRIKAKLLKIKDGQG